MTTVPESRPCRCGYDLRGQAVTVDDRLGLPVVRCPECGTFSAAGSVANPVAAGWRWVGTAAATLGALAWAGLLLGGVVAAGVGIAGRVAACLDGYSVFAHVIEDPETGRPAAFKTSGRRVWRYDDRRRRVGGDYYGRVPGGRQVLYLTSDHSRGGSGRHHVIDLEWLVVPRNGPLGHFERDRPDRDRLRCLAESAGFAAGAVGLLAVAAWHLRRRWHVAAAVVLATVPSAWAAVGFTNGPDTRLADVWAIGQAAMFGGAALAAGVLAAFLARPVLRGLVRLLLPPGMRGPVGFLWRSA